MLHAFSSIENVHLLTATPFYYSLALVLFGATALKKRCIAIAFFAYMIALSFHPGAFLGIFIIFLISVIEKYHGFRPKTFKQLGQFISFRELYIQPALVTLLICLSWAVYRLTNVDLLMLNDTSSEFNDGIFELFLENAVMGFKYILIFFSKYTFIWLTLPLLLYLFVVKDTSFNVKSPLLAWGLAWTLTLFNHIPGHPGGLTTYLLQYLGVFVPLYLAQLFNDHFEITVNGHIKDWGLKTNILNRWKRSKLAAVSILIIYLCINVYSNTQAQITSRMERHNFQNITQNLIKLDQKLDERFRFIVQDKISYLFLLNSLEDRRLEYLDTSDATSNLLEHFCRPPYVVIAPKNIAFSCRHQNHHKLVWEDTHFVAFKTELQH